jgi:hypothetical protein
VTLKSLVCSPDGVTVATHVARECQLSREVVARLLCKVDTKSRAPFSEPLLPSVGSRLTQLSGRKGAARQRKDNGAAAEGEEAGAGAGSGGKGERKAWSLDMSKLKRQRKRRTTAEIAADKAAGAESKGRKRPKKDGGACMYACVRVCVCGCGCACALAECVLMYILSRKCIFMHLVCVYLHV